MLKRLAPSSRLRLPAELHEGRRVTPSLQFVVCDPYLTAPDGPMPPELRLSPAWTWIVAALGIAIVVVGGLVL
jgi:hypothetical protein